MLCGATEAGPRPRRRSARRHHPRDPGGGGRHVEPGEVRHGGWLRRPASGSGTGPSHRGRTQRRRKSSARAAGRITRATCGRPGAGSAVGSPWRPSRIWRRTAAWASATAAGQGADAEATQVRWAMVGGGRPARAVRVVVLRPAAEGGLHRPALGPPRRGGDPPPWAPCPPHGILPPGPRAPENPQPARGAERVHPPFIFVKSGVHAAARSRSSRRPICGTSHTGRRCDDDGR